MSRYSDSESLDSDDGIRFKTASVRNKEEKNLSFSRTASNKSRSSRSRRRSSSSDDTFSKNPTVLPSKLKKGKEGRSCIGPQLAPHIRKKEECVDNSSSIGPQLPPHLLKKEENENSSALGPQLITNPAKKNESSVETSYIGPQLPPHLKKNEEVEESTTIGPQMSSNVAQKQVTSSCIGPQLPPHLRQKLEENVAEESDDEIYGPLPVGTSTFSKSQIALEERALQLKMDQLEPNKDKPPSREEWMLELPEVKAARFGLGPRQFRSKAGPDLSDRSSWTDTPEQKQKKKKKKSDKVDLKKDSELKEIRRRDEEQEKIAKKLKKKNKESLLEMHQTQMKKKKTVEGPSERRPFSRDIDLQVNRFDEAQKKAVLKKAQLLDDRFSSGQSKFL